MAVKRKKAYLLCELIYFPKGSVEQSRIPLSSSRAGWQMNKFSNALEN